jgi:hypothetical protein
MSIRAAEPETRRLPFTPGALRQFFATHLRNLDFPEVRRPDATRYNPGSPQSS